MDGNSISGIIYFNNKNTPEKSGVFSLRKFYEYTETEGFTLLKPVIIKWVVFLHRITLYITITGLTKGTGFYTEPVNCMYLVGAKWKNTRYNLFLVARAYMVEYTESFNDIVTVYH